MFRCFLSLGLLAVATGCAKQDTDPASLAGMSANQVAVLRSQMLLAVEPPASETVIEVHNALQSADKEKTPDEVSVIGQIGGMPNPYGQEVQPQFPWIDGIAGFFLVDPTTAAQFEGHQHEQDEECAFCLGKARDLIDTVAMVTMVGEGSTPIAASAEQLLGLKEGDQVVVTGKARNELGTLMIEARGVHVRPKNPASAAESDAAEDGDEAE
jgi:hypothetical protein